MDICPYKQLERCCLFPAGIDGPINREIPLGGITKKCTISLDVGDATIRLVVRQFIPHSEDILAGSDWPGPGDEIPPMYAIEDLYGACGQICNLFRRVWDKFIRRIVFFHPDAYIAKTFKVAMNTAQNKQTLSEDGKILCRAMQLYTSYRLVEKTWVFKDSTTPVFPMIATQLDCIVREKMVIPLRDHCAASLKLLVETRGISSWFVAFLVTFLLLHHIDQVTIYDIQRRETSFPGSFANPGMIQQLQMTAKALLSCFHRGCMGENGHVQTVPMNWANILPFEMELLNVDQRDYLLFISDWARLPGTLSDLRAFQARKEYDSERGYWATQLFHINWQPIPD
ncbi:hypothetical protein HD806DRAFT_547972 [Xylariaceae sp. AK1471]|nr:hypothetical protein HD806DRAFT_547972 [Xylariaceae sp. AK1471]